MPRIWELRYGEESDFFPTKEKALRARRWEPEPMSELIAHDYEPTREGVCDLIRRVHAPDERRG